MSSGGKRKGAGAKPAPADQVKSERVTVFLSAAEAQRLDEVAAKLHLERAAVIRAAIHAAWVAWQPEHCEAAARKIKQRVRVKS